MRTVSAARNRTLLLILGLLLLAEGIGLTLLATGAAAALGGGASGLPGPTATVGSLLGPAGQYLFAIGVAVTVLAVLFGLWWLLHQIPGKPRTTTYRLAGDPENGSVEVDPGVLARAVQDQLDAVPGIEKASVSLLGSARQPEAVVNVTIGPTVPVDWALERVYGEALRDLRTALETPLTHVALQLDAARQTGTSNQSSTRGQSPRSEETAQTSLA